MLYDRNGISLIFSLLLYVSQSAGQDPCFEGTHQDLGDIGKRSPSYTMDSVPLCDRYITETWYTTKNHVMPSSAPSLSYCGTLYPVWLRGNTPSDGQTLNMTACEVGFVHDCERQYTIAVKNCSSFLVYKLKPLDVCSAAYCFEPGSDCVDETIQDIKVSYHNITWKSYKNNIPGIEIVRHEPYINLLCSFTPSTDDTLLYHIDWYLDNDAVIQGQIVDKESLQDAILSAEDLINAGKKINSWIHCVVGAVASTNNFPCISKPSTSFFAGIEILNKTVSLERMGTAQIMFRLTIPFVPLTVDVNGQQYKHDLSVQVSFPGDPAIEQECKLQGSALDCERKIESFTYDNRLQYDDPVNWQKVYTITVQNSDGIRYYLPTNHFRLRLKTTTTNGQGDKIFSDVTLHDIKINVIETENAWKGKRCSSYADPHQTTFDGYHYECQDTGCITGKTYIFYRNEEFLQEVQVRHGSCWGPPRCICAVAVRAGQDVFTIDFCSGTHYINFPICKDKSLKVIKEDDFSYTILFPTGTSVKILLYNYGIWVINLEVYPTVLDVSRTTGLCGFLDGNITNDLRREDGTFDDIGAFSSNHPDAFSLSWQSKSTEDLLSMSQIEYDQLDPLSRSPRSHQLCLCDQNTVSCSYKYNGCKTRERGKEYLCGLHTNTRSRRDLQRFASFIKHDEEFNGLLRVKRQTMTEVEAFTECNDAFQQSTYYDTCFSDVPNFSNETIVNCMRDLAVTGDHNLTKLHLDTALRQCQEYVLLNSTLQDENPAVTTIIINLCPNNCSNRGVCSGGNCTCDPGFGGSDCSFDVLSPPTITGILDSGICDKSEDACDEITLFGYYFLENMGTTCYVTRNEINGSKSVMSTTSYHVRLEERTLFEGYCSLQFGPESSWITRFQFSLSNDGNRYSENYSVYVYDSNCQTFHNDSGDIYCTLQNGYCFINGSCVPSGAVKTNESCWQCSPGIEIYDWTWDCNITGTSDTPPITTTSLPVNASTEKSTSSMTTPSSTVSMSSDGVLVSSHSSPTTTTTTTTTKSTMVSTAIQTTQSLHNGSSSGTQSTTTHSSDTLHVSSETEKQDISVTPTNVSNRTISSALLTNPVSSSVPSTNSIITSTSSTPSRNQTTQSPHASPSGTQSTTTQSSATLLVTSATEKQDISVTPTDVSTSTISSTLLTNPESSRVLSTNSIITSASSTPSKNQTTQSPHVSTSGTQSTTTQSSATLLETSATEKQDISVTPTNVSNSTISSALLTNTISSSVLSTNSIITSTSSTPSKNQAVSSLPPLFLRRLWQGLCMYYILTFEVFFYG
uniref:von Willebrand factor D and EGF domain-containing protein-like n=1 Tax=Crassostrea virginica TaxID=6565 RepID=A0A8B8CR30_CRAVI|nr:von Willebrand factor D and EGF domain-containing protein-like [Crassostrea virginica]